MKSYLYSLQDVKTGYLMPTVADNDAVATRNFAIAIRQRDSIPHFYPGDFRLYRIGTFDTQTGVITPENPYLVVEGRSMIADED